MKIVVPAFAGMTVCRVSRAPSEQLAMEAIIDFRRRYR
jgi:hypothetical protein